MYFIGVLGGGSIKESSLSKECVKKAGGFESKVPNKLQKKKKIIAGGSRH